LESLHQFVPKEILPRHFGGDLDDEEAFDVEYEESVFTRKEYYDKIAS